MGIRNPPWTSAGFHARRPIVPGNVSDNGILSELDGGTPAVVLSSFLSSYLAFREYFGAVKQKGRDRGLTNL